MDISTVRVLWRDNLSRLLAVLVSQSYRVIGPTVRDGAIVYEEIRTVADLPEGWTDRQDAGRYRLERRGDARLFGHAVGPHSWKRFLFPPRTRLWQAERHARGSIAFRPDAIDAAPYAFIGVRSCELHAIAVQDQVLMDSDPLYRAHRERAFIVAVNCGEAGGTCFCASMNTGPRAVDGFDLALTEILDSDRHVFIVEVGSDRGCAVLDAVPTEKAQPADLAAAARCIERARRQSRSLETAGLPDLLNRNLEHPRWEAVASRCLACANCTMVCPTCFCSTIEDTLDLAGDHAERWRSWDSCFTQDFSYLHGGSVRTSTAARYRQWLTHKLSTWHDQFGTSGCVGCGRCITWCPVGIDLTAEVGAIRQSEKAHGNP